MTRIVKAPATRLKIISCSHKAITKIELIPIMLAQLAMLVNNSVVIKIAQATPNNGGLYAKRIPALVATALPPWKWSNIEKV